MPHRTHAATTAAVRLSDLGRVLPAARCVRWMPAARCTITGTGSADIPSSCHLRSWTAAQATSGCIWCTSGIVSTRTLGAAVWRSSDGNSPHHFWLAGPADLADDGDHEPKEPDNDGHNNVGDFDGVSGVGEA